MRESKYYLTHGKMTEIGPEIKRLADSIEIQGSTEETVKQIMRIMADNVSLDTRFDLQNKFRRPAEKIVKDKKRNGCCDSSTLFVTLCRAKGIPAVQIITADMTSMKNGNFREGHFFSGYYSREENDWFFIDSNKTKEYLAENSLRIRRFNPSSKFIDGHFYIFACEKDYSEYDNQSIKIDCKENMFQIHRMVYEEYQRSQKSTDDGLR